MATGRTVRSLVSKRRRRTDDEEVEEDRSVVVEDSQSEGSVISDDEEDDHHDFSSADGTALTDPPVDKLSDPIRKPPQRSRKSRRGGKQDSGIVDRQNDIKSSFQMTADTQAMMHGLPMDESLQTSKAVDFEEISPVDYGPVVIGETPSHAPQRHLFDNSNIAERQRKEHEEYRRKRDSDPSFTPNRGTFFMHDTRGQMNGHSGPFARGGWPGRGRGRGRTMQATGSSPLTDMSGNSKHVAERPWKHDLHDTINEEPIQDLAGHQRSSQQDHGRSGGPADLAADGQRLPPPSHQQQRVVSFSTTKLLGKVQIRVNLPGMSKPAVFSDVPWNHYTRLPNHRPPLRRDKPVRISIPPHYQRFVFPSQERSFIFIPRQLRPNQQGYNRQIYQRNAGGYGYSSRRTSMYGGSVYSGSVAASRRSSIAGLSRADAFSPVPFVGPHAAQYGRPVVRLPYGSQPMSSVSTPPGPHSDRHTPSGAHMVHMYPLPQQPTFQGIPTTTMHQPRPQKAISVTGIESPSVLQHPNQGQEAQPFQGQLPAHIQEQTGYGQPLGPYFSPHQQYPSVSNQTDPSLGGQHSSFGSAPYVPAPYYNPYPTQTHYYYPGFNSGGYGAMPMYVNGPNGYVVNNPIRSASNSRQPGPQGTDPSLGSTQERSQSQSGMVAHESNGMVFYMPASEAQSAPQGETYQPAESFVPSYAMPGLPPPTPAPENMYFYPPMPMPGMEQQAYYPHPG